jgi:tryptophanyl-tRNA synthetase
MSKSYNNSITLGEDAVSVEQKLKRMVTDTNRVKRTDKGNPDTCPAFDYHKVFSTEEEQAEIRTSCTSASIGCIDCKNILIKHVQALLAPIREKRTKYEKEITDVAEFLGPSQRKANEIAEETLSKVRKVLKI